MQLETINLDQLSEILTAATITGTIDHDGMLAHVIDHPTIGKATTVQGNAGALLIKNA